MKFDNKILLKAVISNREIGEKVIPEIQSSWYSNEPTVEKMLTLLIDYLSKYQHLPNDYELRVLSDKDEDTAKLLTELNSIPKEEIETDCIISNIEKSIKDKKLELVSREIVDYLYRGKEAKDFDKEIQNATSFNLNTSIGLDIKDDIELIYDKIHSDERFVKTGLKTMDKLLKGGFSSGTISFFLLPTNIGKTMIMCSLAANMIRNGYKVLYINFEDGGIKIMQRILQNVLDMSNDEMLLIDKKRFLEKARKEFANVKNSVKVETFPGGTKSANNLRSYINDLNKKKKFKPDIVFLDYVGCMIPNGEADNNSNMATRLEVTVDQTKSLAMELDIPFVTAAQVRRDALESDNIALKDIGNSIGMAFKADDVISGIQNEEQFQNNIIVLKVLKTRDGGKFERHPVGCDISKQKIFDLQAELQTMADVKQAENAKIEQQFEDFM